jgi:hypothetical protein
MADRSLSHAPGPSADFSLSGAPAAAPPVLDRAAFERTAQFVKPDVLRTHLGTLAGKGDALLRQLSAPPPRAEVADAAHTIAGSAGMFGFVCLAAKAREFERAFQAGAADLSAVTLDLRMAIEDSLAEIRRLVPLRQ